MRLVLAFLAILPALASAQTAAPIAPAPVTPAPVVTVTAAPITPAPVTITAAPVTPAPVTPAPVTITAAPVTPAPVTPAPVTITAAPVTPAPVTPAPVTITVAPVTPAPITPAPVFMVTAAPITPAPVTTTVAPATPAPVTLAPVTKAPITPAPVFTLAPITPAPTPNFVVEWAVPLGDSLPPFTADIGDVIKFMWEGLYNVYINPSGNCTDQGRIFIGDQSGTSYTITETDGGKDLVFTTGIGFFCENGLIMTVTVVNPPTIAPIAPTIAPVAPTFAPTFLTEIFVIDWFIPIGSSLPGLSLKSGDTVIFNWTGLHNVWMHDSGLCDDSNGVFIGNSNGTSYTFSDNEVGLKTFVCRELNHCENGLIMVIAVAPRIPITSSPVAPTAAPVTAAPVTTAPITPTPAPVMPTIAPVAPSPPTALPEELMVNWEIPESFELPRLNATAGDTITFLWIGTSNVYIHPDGDCSEEGRISVGNVSGTTYEFTAADRGKNITFASDIGFHCEKGQILIVEVAPPTFVICFSGNSEVEKENQGLVKMSSLEIGDSVLVAGNKYEPIYSFGHRNAYEFGKYLRLHVDGVPLPIEISPDHLILSPGAHWVPASTLHTGDSLTTSDGNHVTIAKIEQVSSEGVFAPFTKSGSIVVNNLVASNYIGYQGSEYMMIGGFKTPLSYHWLAHTFNSFHRVAFSLGFTHETYTEAGVSRWVDIPNKWGSWLLKQHPVALVAVLVPSVITFTAISLLEQRMWAFTVLAALIIACTFKVKKCKVQI